MLPPPASCTVQISTATQPIFANYYVRLLDTNGATAAVFDNFETLHIERRINDVGSYTLSFFDNNDQRYGMFGLDYLVEVFRTVPGVGLGWYREFGGFHRTEQLQTEEDGRRRFTSSGPDYNDLLRRSTIAYKAGTIRSDKSESPSETAMKEYVEENCGTTADSTVVGRMYVGGYPDFIVQPDTGAGSPWTGSRAFENVLDVLKDISQFSSVDFWIDKSGLRTFTFKTRIDQAGENRTTELINPATGKNKYGNMPVIFSVERGNIRSISFSYDRLTEANVVVVPGKGDGSTRTVVTVYDATRIDDSPWNRVEITRPAGSYDDLYETYSLQTIGREALAEFSPKTNIEFVPLQQETTLYGKHYFLGDKVVVRYKGVDYFKKIVGIVIDVQDSREDISVEFSEVTFETS